MIENSATYGFLIENENQSLKHSFQRKIRSAEIHGGARRGAEDVASALKTRAKGGRMSRARQCAGENIWN